TGRRPFPPFIVPILPNSSDNIAVTHKRARIKYQQESNDEKGKEIEDFDNGDDDGGEIGVPPFEMIPNEITIHIFGFLNSSRDLAAAGLACRLWYIMLLQRKHMILSNHPASQM